VTDAVLLRVLDHVQRTTPKALAGRVRKLEAIVAKTRELLAQMPKCTECDALATHSDSKGHGRRCREHREPGSLPFQRAKAQAELVAMLADACGALEGGRG